MIPGMPSIARCSRPFMGTPALVDTALLLSLFAGIAEAKAPDLKLFAFVTRCEKDSVFTFIGCENVSGKKRFVWQSEFDFWQVGGFNRKTFDHKDIVEDGFWWGAASKPDLDTADLVPLPPGGIFGKTIAFEKKYFKPDDFMNKYLVMTGIDLHVKSSELDSARAIRVSGELTGRNIRGCLETSGKK